MVYLSMEIQLTKTKTITIGGGTRRRHRGVDVVGVDLFTGDARGCPAVRLTERKGALHVAAAGFVPPPANALPGSWEAAAKSCTWSLPAAFQAPHAALAVTSPDMFLAQTTHDAFRADFSAGMHHVEDAAAKPRRLGVRREAKPAPAVPAADAPTPAPGVPVSNGGTRFVMKPLATEGDFVLEAGLPEYQILWLSRLLPEGRRPTAVSVQLRPSALAASLLRQPAFIAAGGSALALFVNEETANIVGYRRGDIALWRTCRGAPGARAIRDALKKGLGLDDAMVADVLDDTLIDPRPVLGPLLAPVFDELAVSRDYLAGKLGVDVKGAFLMGVGAGAAYWRALAEERARLELVAPPAFDGLARDDRLAADAALAGPAANAFLGALGAALAYLEEEADA